ncbi:MAG: DMT family transporter [Reyranella sp.]|uniref:DMT family transporter n=1 Tax=Reyranella sp. TaxID=1929291 RepID=UPI001AC40456|nr:DMT family transporter [Reyranella sp.]MBN9087214.1 DMT family transporter [Reyranella sp.]
MSWRVWIWLLSLSVLWGGSFFFAKVAIETLPPLTVVFGRVALAALALNLVNPLRRDAPWRAFFAMGALNNVVPFALIFWGQTHIASGLASILNATTPLFTIVVAHALTDDEKMTGAKVGALLMGVAGVAVLIGPAALAQPSGSLWGELACLGAALSYAFAGIYGRRFRAMGVAPLDAAAGQVTTSSVLILPIMLAVDQPWTLPLPPSETWAALAGLALLSTALGYVLYFRILAAAGATNLLLVTFLIPVTSIVLGSLFLQERLEPRHFAGMAVIGLGLAVIDGRMGRLLHPAK